MPERVGAGFAAPQGTILWPAAVALKHCGPEVLQRLDVASVLLELAWCLADHWDAGKRGVPDQRPKPIQTNLTMSDMPVAVAMRVQRILGVVGVDQPQPVDSNGGVELSDQIFDPLRLGEIHSSGVHMACVQADAETGMPVARIQYLGRFVDSAGNRTGGSGGQLQQQVWSPLLRSEHCTQCPANSPQCLHPIPAHALPGMDYDAGGTELDGPVHSPLHHPPGLFSGGRRGGSEVYEIGSMQKKGSDIAVRHLTGKDPIFLRLGGRSAPLPGVGGEDLDGLGSPVEGPFYRHRPAGLEAPNMYADAPHDS